jgi:cold-inducible RNA-binding protein
MNTRLYVGNLAPTATAKELQGLFSPHGNVAEVNLPVERGTGRSRGFGVITMATPQGAQAAMLALNGKELGARVLMVTEARPREEGVASYPAGTKR